MKPLSRLAQAMPRSGIREVMELAATLPDVIHLEVGEPSFNTPDHVVDAAFADARAGFTKYTSNAGIPSLRAAIAERVSEAWGVPVEPAQTIVSTGAVGALTSAIFAISEEGDEILVPDPGWPNYMSIIALNRATPVRYPIRPEDDYVPTVEAIADRITPRTKAILVNNPGNPTGAVFPQERVRELVELARSTDTFLISDEVYEEMVFEGRHASAGLFPDERTIVISGASKTYAMTGWRLGYAVAHPDVVALMAKLQEPLVTCAPSVSQRAAEAAIRGPQDAVREMCNAYRRRRDFAWDLLGTQGLLAARPHGAFYAMVDLRPLGRDSRWLASTLLKEEQVATAPGDTFGPSSEGMLRISLATDDTSLAEGCRRIAQFAARHGFAPSNTLAGSATPR